MGLRKIKGAKQDWGGSRQRLSVEAAHLGRNGQAVPPRPAQPTAEDACPGGRFWQGYTCLAAPRPPGAPLWPVASCTFPGGPSLGAAANVIACSQFQKLQVSQSWFQTPKTQHGLQWGATPVNQPGASSIWASTEAATEQYQVQRAPLT